MRDDLKASRETVGRFESRIDTFQIITFTVLGIIVAALSFIALYQFGGLSTNTEESSNWQKGSWVIVLVAILILTSVLAYAGVKTIRGNKDRGT